MIRFQKRLFASGARTRHLILVQLIANLDGLHGGWAKKPWKKKNIYIKPKPGIRNFIDDGHVRSHNNNNYAVVVVEPTSTYTQNLCYCIIVLYHFAYSRIAPRKSFLQYSSTYYQYWFVLNQFYNFANTIIVVIDMIKMLDVNALQVFTQVPIFNVKFSFRK